MAPRRKRPASAGSFRGKEEGTNAMAASHGGRGDAVSGVRKQQGRTKIRPSSATVRGRNDISSHTPGLTDYNYLHDFAASRQQGLPYDAGGLRGDTRVLNHGKGGMYSAKEMEIIAGSYKLSKRQESTFREFVAMLVDFDACSVVHILDNAFREAQLATGLQDFTGGGVD